MAASPVQTSDASLIPTEATNVRMTAPARTLGEIRKSCPPVPEGFSR